MYSLKIKCPYCLHQVHISLNKVTQYHSRRPATENKLYVQQPRTSEITSAKAYSTDFCTECNNPLMIAFECSVSELVDMKKAINNKAWVLNAPLEGSIKIYPELRLPDDSPHYPEKIRAVFTELQEDVRSGRTAPRIIVGCRSVLEVALRSLGYEKGNLLSRIELARQDGILTESMKNWAHRIRMEGNEAVHELEASDEQAKEFVAFLRLFLEVAFVLPERIKEQQQ